MVVGSEARGKSALSHIYGCGLQVFHKAHSPQVGDAGAWPGRPWLHRLGGAFFPGLCVGAHSPCVFATKSSLPSLRLQATRTPLVLLNPWLAWDRAVDSALSQEPCGRPSGHWSWGCNFSGPHADPWALIVLKHSPYHLFFQCPL
ncbi:hypothetical protein HJG60_011203 [Phyllostomus discolor]|uniref:Uncharacterized protein n=1 Tax=Phyllostomus discolor TaxID=89673 RepID=A0A834E591_9CHIR|nr:hypothetical protein HJG60_011203 [Phyllostomus discolor]